MGRERRGVRSGVHPEALGLDMVAGWWIDRSTYCVWFSAVVLVMQCAWPEVMAAMPATARVVYQKNGIWRRRSIFLFTFCLHSVSGRGYAADARGPRGCSGTSRVASFMAFDEHVR